MTALNRCLLTRNRLSTWPWTLRNRCARAVDGSGRRRGHPRRHRVAGGDCVRAAAHHVIKRLGVCRDGLGADAHVRRMVAAALDRSRVPVGRGTRSGFRRARRTARASNGAKYTAPEPGCSRRPTADWPATLLSSNDRKNGLALEHFRFNTLLPHSLLPYGLATGSHYHCTPTGYWWMSRSGVTMAIWFAIAWQISILSNGSLCSVGKRTSSKVSTSVTGRASTSCRLLASGINSVGVKPPGRRSLPIPCLTLISHADAAEKNTSLAGLRMSLRASLDS